MREKGGILLMAIIFIGVMSSIVIFLFESSLLQVKMVAGFQRVVRQWQAVAATLYQREIALEETRECILPECELLAFVPDGWYEMDTTGVRYYRLYGPLSSTDAIRDPHEAMPYYLPPDYEWVNVTAFRNYPVIGSDPDRKGIRVYQMKVLPTGEGSVIEAIQVLPTGEQRLIYQLYERGELGVPTLWHGLLIVEKPQEHTIAIYNAADGKKDQEAVLRPQPLLVKYPFCARMPKVVIEQSREQKRKIIVLKSRWVEIAEVTLDFEKMGRRTEVRSSYGLPE